MKVAGGNLDILESQRSWIEDIPYWFVLPIEGCEMQRFNPSAIYRLGAFVGAVTRSPDDRSFDDKQARKDCYMAKFMIDTLVSGGILPYSAGCLKAARDFAKEVDQAFEASEARAGGDEKAVGGSLSTIKWRAEKFETLFHGDCEAFNLFNVPDVLAYSATTLIERGESLIHESLHRYLTDVMKSDVRDAARCIVFELPTASAFHIARATEGAMREYYKKFIGNGSLPANYQQQTFGSLIAEYSANGIDPSLVGNLTHIKDHYRNPISHPEVVVTASEAHKLLGIYVAAIVDMLGRIEQGTA